MKRRLADSEVEHRLALLCVGASWGSFDVIFANAYGVLRPEDAALLFLTPVAFAFIPTLAAFLLPRGSRWWITLAAAVTPIALACLRGSDTARVTPSLTWLARFAPFLALATLMVWLALRWSSPDKETKLFVALSTITVLSILGLEIRVPLTVPTPFRIVALTFFAESALVIIASAALGARFGPSFRLLGLSAPLLFVPLARPIGDRPPPVNHEQQTMRPVTAAPRPNTLVIVLDSVRADRLPPTEGRTVQTPAIDEFARSAFVFRHAIASGNYTLPSHASLLTGLLPSEHAAHPRYAGRGDEHGSIRPGIETFPRALQKEGVATFGVSSNHAFLSAWTGVPAGFDYFSDRPLRLFAASAFGPALLRAIAHRRGGFVIRTATYRPADDILTEVRVHLGGITQPFFGLVNLMDAHDPRVLSADGALLTPGAARIRSYDEAVAFEDTQLGAFFSWMRARGLFETTTIILTADHGEYLEDHGRRGHGVGSDEEVLHIPLLVRPAGGLSAASLVSHPFGLHEVLPWVLGMSSASDVAPQEPLAPRVLAEVWTNPGAGAVAGFPPDERIVYFGPLKLVVPWSGGPRLFDLSRDPDEARNLWNIEPRGKLMESVAHQPIRRPSSTSPNLPDAAALERLRSLGYAK